MLFEPAAPKQTHRVMVGARDAGSLRRDDFHPTPPQAVEALLRVENFAGPIWEPACGDGAIVSVLRAAGHDVVATDLNDRGLGGSVDFLLEQTPLAPNVITNPPFKLGEEFAETALRLCSGKIALLLRLVWLAGQRRRQLFEKAPLARVWVFSARLPMMHREGHEGPKNSSAIDFAWFVWDRTHTGRPEIGWVP
jgi:hypothetical protein